MIHIVNGDIVGLKLQELEGDIIVWREMYDFGPILHGFLEEGWIQSRANFFEEEVGIPATLFIENYQFQNQILNNLPKTTEITLWFEHDRYDQTMLIFLLSKLSREGFSNLYMVSIDKHPGVNPFYGLGQLSSEQLIKLYQNQKMPISQEQITEAVSAWTAYSSSNPSNLEKWITTISNEYLPFLKRAMQAHLEYFPSTLTGLNEVENLVFRFINNRTCSFPDLFSYITKQRSQDGLSDLHFASIINQLTKGKFPLIHCDVPLPNFENPEPKSNISLTPYGIEILHGIRDRFDFIGINWWLGGVHLQDDLWRWNGKKLIKVLPQYEK
jgi:hypothetical protein